MIQVANKKTHHGPGEDISRPTPLGNPFSHLTFLTRAEHIVGSREEAVARYESWFDEQMVQDTPAKRQFMYLANKHLKGEDLTLLCHCSPLACHGDVVKRKIEAVQPFKVLVTGGRDYSDIQAVFFALDAAHAKRLITLIIEGGCRPKPDPETGYWPKVSADYLAFLWAESRNVPCLTCPADWKTHGRAAGPIRNQNMIDLHNPDAGIQFQGGAGTADMVSRLVAAGKKVWTPFNWSQPTG